jgi:hypothetical protein
MMRKQFRRRYPRHSRSLLAVTAEDRDGTTITGWYFILRPEHSKATLSPLHMSTATKNEGELMGLLR